MQIAKFRFSRKKHFTGDNSEWKHNFRRGRRAKKRFVLKSTFEETLKYLYLPPSNYVVFLNSLKDICEETMSKIFTYIPPAIGGYFCVILSQKYLKKLSRKYFYLRPAIEGYFVFAVKFRKLMIKCSSKLNWASGENIWKRNILDFFPKSINKEKTDFSPKSIYKRYVFWSF